MVANLVVFVLLVVPVRGGARWLRHFAFLPLPVMGAQLLVEGPRWQMVPAYALGGLFFLVWLVWLLRTIKPAGRPAGRRWTRRLAAGLGIGLGVLGLVVSTALPMVLPVFRFPHPTGPYDIGTLTYHWVDASRPEVFTANPDDRRELMVQIWYPAWADPSSPCAPYIPDAGAVAPALARFIKLPEFTLGHLKYVTTNAVASAPVADGEHSYPVLILLVGLGGYRQEQTFQVEDLRVRGRGLAFRGIDRPGTRRVPRQPAARHLPAMGNVDPGWRATAGGAHELRLTERLGAFHLGAGGADHGGAVPPGRAQRATRSTCRARSHADR